MQALAAHLPRLAARIPWVPLGTWPTPIRAVVVAGRTLWIKVEGDADPAYGGNKVRCLELWLGHARARGARRIWALGAYGSNHAVATAIHAPRAGLEAAALLCPQPRSPWAIENAGALIGAGIELRVVPSVAALPLAALAIAARERGALVMPPGGATPLGALGAVSAVFELAAQIALGVAPAPARIVLPLGSACTAAGLLAGLHLAHATGAWRGRLPIVHAVRVTPWPITSRVRTAVLARRTLARIAALGGPAVAVGLPELVHRLVVDPRELGAGYGEPTARAERALTALPGIRLDGVYAGKAASALLRLHGRGEGPLLFWATKATTILPAPPLAAVRAAPAALVRWLDAAAPR